MSDIGSGYVLDYWKSEVDQLLMTSWRQTCISYSVVLVQKNLIGERVHCPSLLHRIDGSRWGLRFCRFRRSSLRKSSATGFRFTLTGTAGTGYTTSLLRVLYSWTCFFQHAKITKQKCVIFNKFAKRYLIYGHIHRDITYISLGTVPNSFKSVKCSRLGTVLNFLFGLEL